jgi:hypothetical protein
MSLVETEYAILRSTIATRGTVRTALLPVTILGWAVVAGALLLFGEVAIAIVFSLAVLVAGYEAIHALHVGVERIGRYVQVYYEAGNDGPQWETTAMAVGPALPGGGIDPLFTVVFICAALSNLIPAIEVGPPTPDLALLVVLHVAFIVRLVRARGAAARQRAVELESFRAIHSQIPQTRFQHPDSGASVPRTKSGTSTNGSDSDPKSPTD